MRIFVLGSGSSGNCLVVEAEGERLVVDAGMGPPRAARRMRSLGAELVTHRAPLGVFVTHDHGDHAGHAVPLARALRARLFTHEGITSPRAKQPLQMGSYAPGHPVSLGPFVVEALTIPHDAPHVALRVASGGKRFGIATDLGHATRELRSFLAGCDQVFLESNYCPRLLDAGPYPMHLKGRVAGPLGHLANEQTADVVRSLQDTRVSQVVLVHVSRTNNEPMRALEVVASRAPRMPVDVVPQGEARRFEVTKSVGSRAAEQLSLAF